MRKYFILFVASFFLFVGSVLALTEAPIDITKMSLIEIENALDKGYITSEQLVNIYLERIEKYNDDFNAINQINEHAVEQAQQLDKLRKEGNIKGRLHGIPIIVKCNIDVYGMPTTGGTKSLKDNMPNANSDVVQKLIDEGAIIIASANMSELAFSASDSYSSYGNVFNVFNSDGYTPFGSSGGSAVSVKAAFAAAALGTDTNSSVRLPAAGAGLVGIRPTQGLLSSDGVIPYDHSRDTVGVISSTVEDSSLLLDVISDGKYTSNTDFSLEGVNIGVPTQYVKGSKSYQGVKGVTDDEIYTMVEKSIKELEDAGANIIYLDNFVKDSNLTIATSTYAGSEMCYYFNEYIKGTTGTIRSFTQLANSSGHVQGLDGYASSCKLSSDKVATERNNKKSIYRDYVSSVFDENDLDVILYPSLKYKVFKIGEDKVASPGSSLGSVIGYPSITVPMGMASDGFSYGIEFLSKADNESGLYNVALSFEQINGNIVDTSPLTPSLYSVSDTITKLNKLYEENYDNSSTKEWINSVQEFYENYNTYSNKDEEAQKLLDSYEDNYNKSVNLFKINKNDNILVKIIKIVVLIVLILIGLYIALYAFAYTVRFIRRLRKRIRKYKKLNKKKAASKKRKNNNKKNSNKRKVTKKVTNKKRISVKRK